MGDNAKLSDVTAASTLTGDESIYVVQGGNSRRATFQNVRDVIGTRVILKRFGAAGDGVTDDTAAINTAFAAGVKLTGAGSTYAVTGDITIPASLDLEDATFKQLSPDSSTRRTLYASGVSNIVLRRVKVDRNGVGTQGGLNTAAGIWIEGGSGHRCSDLEVYGNGRGSGVVIHSTTDGIYENLHGHDIAYDDTGATDDLVQGVWLFGNTNCTFSTPRANDLTGNANGQIATRFTRGVAMGGNVRCTVLAPHIEDVDQGVDISGSDGNIECQVIGGNLKNIGTWGVKLANSAVRCKVIGVTVENSGIAGFVASGPSESGLTHKTMDNDFIGCVSINPGYNGFAATNCGFRVTVNSFDTDFPKGTRFIDCKAIDTDTGTGTMEFGFHSEITYDGTSLKPNELQGCRSIGHTNSFSSGFAHWNVLATGTGTLSIPDTTQTDVDWDSEIYDGIAGHSTVTNNNVISPKISGFYHIEACVVFASNATGYRKLVVLHNGVEIPGGVVSSPAVDGDVTALSVSVLRKVVVGDNVKIQVVQTSTGALNIDRTKSTLGITLVDAI